MLEEQKGAGITAASRELLLCPSLPSPLQQWEAAWPGSIPCLQADLSHTEVRRTEEPAQTS